MSFINIITINYWNNVSLICHMVNISHARQNVFVSNLHPQTPMQQSSYNGYNPQSVENKKPVQLYGFCLPAVYAISVFRASVLFGCMMNYSTLKI